MSDFDLDDIVADGLVEELREAVTALKKRFNLDTIQLLATTLEANGNTRSYKAGVGNWYGRYGQAITFVAECANDDIAAATPSDEDGL